MYHRVTQLSCDPWGLAVAPDNFAAQVKQLVRTRKILSMEEFIFEAARGKLASRIAAITFDDGYLDNLTASAPILAEFGAPATLFLATGPMQSGRPYWWDELAAILFDPEPMEGELAIGERLQRVKLGPAEPADKDLRLWRAWHKAQSMRQALHWQLWNEIRVLPPGLVEPSMAALRALRHTPLTSLARPMSIEEVRQLVSRTTFTVAGHSVDHPDLPTLPDAEIIQQLLQSKQQIMSLFGTTVSGFAYPYGRFDARVRHLVEAAGFGWACSTQAGSVGPGCDRFVLPRLTAIDEPGLGWMR